METPKIFTDFYEAIKCYWKRPIPGIDNNNNKLFLPLIPLTLIQEICQKAKENFHSDEQIMHINGEVIVIGDLHGHIADLLRIFKKFGWPPARNYLFLGDIIDRGEFSTETIVLILLLKCLFNENIFVIRGNHEFPDMYTRGGFLAELQKLYKEDLAEQYFRECFNEIPIAALINEKALCIHGGIGPGVTSLDDIRSIPRPLESYVREPQQTILWSDPNEYSETFEPSSRGIGYFFGENSLLTFLSNNNLSILVRGHECMEKGVQMFFKRKCMTVFSASRYCNATDNKAGVALFKEDGSFEITTFPPVKVYLLRARAQYVSLESYISFSENDNKPMHTLPSLAQRSPNSFRFRNGRQGRKLSKGNAPNKRSLPMLSPKRMTRQNKMQTGYKTLSHSSPL